MSAAWQKDPVAAAGADTILSVNNIEVVYDHVILVLKGVSLTVPARRHRGAARGQRRRQDHDA
jgi:branched-chain amino acid transport system ATP-binding protein